MCGGNRGISVDLNLRLSAIVIQDGLGNVWEGFATPTSLKSGVEIGYGTGWLLIGEYLINTGRSRDKLNII